MTVKLTKPVRLLLEEMFSAEIDHARGLLCFPIVQRKPSKLVSAMLADGLIAKASELLPGRFPVRIDGYVLTHKGRAIYCEWAGEQDIGDDDGKGGA